MNADKFLHFGNIFTHFRLKSALHLRYQNQTIMHVLTLSKTENDFTQEFLDSVSKIKPSVLDFHTFLKDEFIHYPFVLTTAD